ncbi:MAG: carbamate kinase [Acholeplasmataceae bacterium]
MSRYVISLGGNALGKDPGEQRDLLKTVAYAILPLIEEGHSIAIVHGNGPQVGMINLAFTESDSTPTMPFAECGAMSQGYIGYHIQNAILNMLEKSSMHRNVTSVVTQVLVDPDDPAFRHPTKPIGGFYGEAEAKKLREELGYDVVEDAGRGYRRVIASPKPVDIIEKSSILTLLEANHIVIAAGGGGIPVIRDQEGYLGVDAVIDKDHASAKMAEIIGADELVILTAVDHVYLDFNTERQKKLERVTVSELETLLEHFKPGSMLPKIEACMAFTRATGRPSIISSLERAEEAFKRKSGTIIIAP